MQVSLTLDEMNILEMYKAETVSETIKNIEDAIPHMESVFQKISEGILFRISEMTDEDLSGLLLFTAFDD